MKHFLKKLLTTAQSYSSSGDEPISGNETNLWLKLIFTIQNINVFYIVLIQNNLEEDDESPKISGVDITILLDVGLIDEQGISKLVQNNAKYSYSDMGRSLNKTWFEKFF